MINKERLLLISALGFAVFLSLAFFVRLKSFVNMDLFVTKSLQSAIGRTFDTPLSIFSIFGSGEVMLPALLILGAVIYTRYKKIFWGLGLFFVVLAIEVIGKIYLFHPGPPARFFRYSIPFILPSAYVKTNYSFPSGHVSRTLFLVTIAIFLVGVFIKNRNRRLVGYLLLLMFALLMLISRVYLGEHWFSDVLGGAALGLSLGSFALLFW